MSAYSGRHAGLYDLFYADKPYAEEAAFVHNCMQRYGRGTTRRVLELACGTGSHAFALETCGYEVVATDGSEDMLEAARAKAAIRTSAVDFRHQDMTALAVGGVPFDAVICLFDSIGYVATNQALERVLNCVHEHLRVDGLFIFEFWHAGAMLRHYEPLRVRRWYTPAGEVVRLSETELECAEQLARVTYTVYELRRDGTCSSFTETQRNRYFLVQEVAGWLTARRFEPIKWFAGFSADEGITEDTWHVLAVARRI